MIAFEPSSNEFKLTISNHNFYFTNIIHYIEYKIIFIVLIFETCLELYDILEKILWTVNKNAYCTVFGRNAL